MRKNKLRLLSLHQLPSDSTELLRSRPGAASYLVLASLCLVGLGSAGMAFLYSAIVQSAQPPVETSSAEESSAGNSSGIAQAKNLGEIISRPIATPSVQTELVDASGNTLSVACSTCHATRVPNAKNKSASDLNEFHSKLELNHGNISCLSCHNDQNYDSLKLADGTSVAYQEVMRLCSQCHGQQAKEYELGVHGGMKGHWDLKYGDQTKNNCVDCHHPHLPAFPKMKPTFKPKDRFLQASEHHHED